MSTSFLCAVDDTTDYRVLLQYLLNRGCPHCDLSLFANGQDFLNALPRFKQLPDLVLLDYHMPTLTGYQTLLRLKQHPAYRSIPIVMMSAQATDTDIQACYGAGANAFMQKTVNIESFAYLLEVTCHYWLTLSQSPIHKSAS
ncbi:MAG: response regulator [Hymenobacter sp.]|nr:MAG: response regulator [Hymenobacter sp.]